ncbi:MAG TPA: hypothetical protein VNU48_08880 [Burkholderiaceae bacterium]|nr:hypothetical protein [Burkholderiaceae bacterium]
MNKPTPDKDLQGEGNYDATRRYDKAAREFVQSGKVDDAAQAAEPGSPEQAESLKRAEEVGKSHSKGEDPAVRKASPSPKK